MKAEIDICDFNSVRRTKLEHFTIRKVKAVLQQHNEVIFHLWTGEVVRIEKGKIKQFIA